MDLNKGKSKTQYLTSFRSLALFISVSAFLFLIPPSAKASVNVSVTRGGNPVSDLSSLRVGDTITASFKWAKNTGANRTSVKGHICILSQWNQWVLNRSAIYTEGAPDGGASCGNNALKSSPDLVANASSSLPVSHQLTTDDITKIGCDPTADFGANGCRFIMVFLLCDQNVPSKCSLQRPLSGSTYGFIPATFVNQPPTANSLPTQTTDENTDKGITLSGSDLEDPTGASLVYSIVTNPTHGTLSVPGASRT